MAHQQRGGRLSVRACDADHEHGFVGRAGDRSRHQRRSTTAVGHHELRDVCVHRALHHDCHGPVSNCFGHEVVRVRGGSLPCEEQIAGLDLTGVLAYSQNGDVPRAAQLPKEADRPEDIAYRV